MLDIDTVKRDQKRLARKLQKKTGQKYTSALRFVEKIYISSDFILIREKSVDNGQTWSLEEIAGVLKTSLDLYESKTLNRIEKDVLYRIKRMK